MYINSMKISLYLTLIAWTGQSIILIPSHQTGSVVVIIQPLEILTQIVNFAQPFASTPQGLVKWIDIDQDSGPQQYNIYPASLSLSQYVIVISSTRNIYSITLNWMAFLDDNLFTQYGEVTQTINSQIASIPMNFLNALNYIPNACFFLNGIDLIATPSLFDTAYNFQVNSVSSNGFVIQVTALLGYTISRFSYTIIYGSPQYLLTGYQSFTSLGTTQLFTPDARTKYSKVGLISIECINNIRFHLGNNRGLVVTQQLLDTSINYITLSYYQYLACPLYCTTCYATAPDCDACISQTLRSGPSCTTCPTQMFSQVDQIKCQQCNSYCNYCSGVSDDCIACKTSTLRSGIPNCTTCPLGMFIELFIDDCQPCRSYCNGCIGSPTSCTSCDLSTLRLNPPDCLNCPSQYHVVHDNQICQPCLPYCDNCVHYASICAACSSSSFRMNPPNCLECPQHMYLDGDTCHQCNSMCNSCDKYGCISCLSLSQYINNLKQCVDCPAHCVTCDTNQCQSCAGNCSQCDLNSCQKCQLDNYYILSTDCIKCPVNCSTCDQTTCLTCVGPRTVQNKICQCQHPCLTCNSNECITCISTDYKIIKGYCELCPPRCIACDEQGNCLQSPQNCKIGISIGKQFRCTQCESNYYLNNNICNKCSSECLECINQPTNCTVCRFSELNSQDCQFCESQIGFYSDYESNNCYTKCGDAIVAGPEQCDDGNSLSLDGCTNCLIDNGYHCNGQVCYTIIYPFPILSQDLTLDSHYNSTKLFLINYNVPIQDVGFDLEFKILPILNFTYVINHIDTQTVEVKIILMEQSLNANLHLIFEDVSKIRSLMGVPQQLQMIKCDISDYLIISNTEQGISEASQTITNSLIILILTLICLAVLFGGLDVFWNLIDLFQVVSYLKYINTVKPQYLQEFLNLFDFLQSKNLPLNQFLNTQNLLENQIDIKNFNAPPLLIQKDGYTSSTIINIVPILNLLITGVFIYYTAQMIQHIIVQMDITRLVQRSKRIEIAILSYELYFYVITVCDNIKKKWIWSSLIRLFMSNAYDICFMICLSIRALQFEHTNTDLKIDLLMTLSSIFSWIIITKSICDIAGFSRKTLIYKQNEFGAVFESLRFNILTKYYNSILLYKKLLFMLFLVLLYNESIFQILSIILLQVSQLLFLIILSPIKDKLERYKQIVCELLMLCTEVQLGILVVDDYSQICTQESRNIYGWICLFSIVLIMITQICIDVLQQYRRMYKEYRLVRRLVDFMSCNQNHSPNQKHPIENFMI